MTKKVRFDSAQRKLFDELGDLEEFIALELGKSAYKNRASQRSLDKYQELINNDTHWKALEILDDFVRDQLADCQSLLDMYADIHRASARQQQLKKDMEMKGQQFTSLDRRQAGVSRTNKAKAEMELADV